MVREKINLDKLFNNNSDCYADTGRFENDGSYTEGDVIMTLTKSKFNELCLEFGRRLLELAAENAKSGYISNGKDIITNVDKQSITSTIKQVEYEKNNN